MKSLGRSSSSGFTLGLERKIHSAKNLVFLMGLDYSQKVNFFRSSGSLEGFGKGVHKGLTQHYLSLPMRVRYTKSKLIQPYFELMVGRRIGQSGKEDNLERLFRPLGKSFLSMGTGLEIQLSSKVSLSLGLQVKGNEFFNRCTNHWSKGALIGLRVRFEGGLELISL